MAEENILSNNKSTLVPSVYVEDVNKTYDILTSYMFMHITYFLFLFKKLIDPK